MHLEKREGRTGTSFRVRITARGFPLISKTFPTKAEALRWGKRMEADLISGRLGTPQAHHHTVADAINRFLEEQPPGFGRWLYEKKTASMLRWWKQHFGGLKLAEVKPVTIVQGRDLLRRNPSPPKRNQRTRFLELDEQERLLKECEADQNLRDVVLMALWTGTRRGPPAFPKARPKHDAEPQD